MTTSPDDENGENSWTEDRMDEVMDQLSEIAGSTGAEGSGSPNQKFMGPLGVWGTEPNDADSAADSGPRTGDVNSPSTDD